MCGGWVPFCASYNFFCKVGDGICNASPFTWEWFASKSETKGHEEKYIIFNDDLCQGFYCSFGIEVLTSICLLAVYIQHPNMKRWVSLLATYNVVNAAQMHVSEHACCEVLINKSRVNGFLGVFIRVVLVVCDPGFVKNLPIFSYRMLGYNSMWFNFRM